MTSFFDLAPFISVDVDAYMASRNGTGSPGPGGPGPGVGPGPGPDSGAGPDSGSSEDPQLLAWIEEAVIASGYDVANVSALASHIRSSFNLVAKPATVSDARMAIGLGVVFYCGASPSSRFFSDAEFSAFLTSVATHGIVPAPDQP